MAEIIFSNNFAQYICIIFVYILCVSRCLTFSMKYQVSIYVSRKTINLGDILTLIRRI